MIKRFTIGEEKSTGSRRNKPKFHYTGANTFNDIINCKGGKSLWFRDVRYLNDKQEGLYFINKFVEYVDSVLGIANSFSKVNNVEVPYVIKEWNCH